MTLILNDFLCAEKLEEGKIMIRAEEGNFMELTGTIISEVNSILKPGQKVEYEHNGSQLVFLDHQIIRNILLNLISNAIKFSQENKLIRINTGVSDLEITIEIKDEGIGIPKDEQARMFERFFRSRNATNIQGTGLGLNIVAKYLDVLSGKITFKSELNEGTTFFITEPNNKLKTGE